MIIYVSGPLSADTPQGMMANVDRAMRAGAALFAEGHHPLIPHLNLFFDLWVKDTYGVFQPSYEDYLALDLALVARCDGLLFLGESPGADRERAKAVRLGLPVWNCVEDVPS